MNRMQRNFINQCEPFLYLLNDWERDFMADLQKRPDEYELSKAQNKKLNEIQMKLQDKI